MDGSSTSPGGVGSSATALGAILEREAELANTLEAARVRVREQVASAQEEVPGLLKRGEAEARTVADQKSQDIRKQAEAEVAEIVAERERDSAALKERLSANLAQAVEVVVGRAADPRAVAPCNRRE